MAAVVTGRVDKKPKMIEGGHAIFRIVNNGSRIDCAAYEPSGEFRESVMKLVVGDLVNIHAGVRPASRTHGLTLNLEGIELIELVKIELSNPVCPKCGKRMKSAGSGKGYKCLKCRYKTQDTSRIETALVRDLHEGLYLPPARAQRHLTRPTARIGKKNTDVPDSLISKWFSY
jgi:tRNA(Ile2)-agmatinylcytidine synthase